MVVRLAMVRRTGPVTAMLNDVDPWKIAQNVSIRNQGRSVRCWAHARRKVYEHHKSDLQISSLALALMNYLYNIERRAMKSSG